jgi:hypothetical protein
MARLSSAQKMTTVSHSLIRNCGRYAAFLAFSLLFAGCHKTDIGSYRVPKEKDGQLPVTVANEAAGSGAPVAAAAGMAGTPVAVAGGPGLIWTAPASWTPKPLGAMRKGSYTLTGNAGATADLSITAFPGAVGGEFANVNRWRNQLSLPPVAESDLDAAVTRFSQNGLTFTLVDLVGSDAANPQRMLGAMTPYEGGMWFFKLTGPDALVTTTKPAFIEFLKTVKAAAPVAP